MGISQQAYGKRERGGADGFSPDDLAEFAVRTAIDARWLLGQIEGPIEDADLRRNPENMVSAFELFRREAARLEEAKKDASGDPLAHRVMIDQVLRGLVEKIARLDRRTMQELDVKFSFVEGLLGDRAAGEKENRAIG
jgi:hypothetical protein